MDKTMTYYARKRHATKAYDPARRISDAEMDMVRELLRFSPSSTNIQPWHFVIAGTEAGKARVAKAAERLYPFNVPTITDASHVIVYASRLEADGGYLRHVLEREEAEGRFAANPRLYSTQQDKGRKLFADLHKQDLKDAQHWLDKQVYLNLGQLLLGVATLGIDATPMEGIDTRALDEELGLRQMGYASLCVVSLGYADPARDYNLALPKSRLPAAEILTEI